MLEIHTLLTRIQVLNVRETAYMLGLSQATIRLTISSRAGKTRQNEVDSRPEPASKERFGWGNKSSMTFLKRMFGDCSASLVVASYQQR